MTKDERQAEIDRASAVIAAAGFERIAGAGRWRRPGDDLAYTWDEALTEARAAGHTPLTAEVSTVDTLHDPYCGHGPTRFKDIP